MEDYMKVVNKIFTLSLSAILGLSFCSASAFAGETYNNNNSKISVKPVAEKKQSPYKLRRSPNIDFCHSIGVLEALRASSRSVPLLHEDEEIFKNLEEEEAKPIDIVSFILELNSESRLMI